MHPELCFLCVLQQRWTLVQTLRTLVIEAFQEEDQRDFLLEPGLWYDGVWHKMCEDDAVAKGSFARLYRLEVNVNGNMQRVRLSMVVHLYDMGQLLMYS